STDKRDIVRQAGMGCSVEVRREAILLGQAVDVRRRGAADNAAVLLVFHDNFKDVAECGDSVCCRSGLCRPKQRSVKGQAHGEQNEQAGGAFHNASFSYRMPASAISLLCDPQFDRARLSPAQANVKGASNTRSFSSTF